MRMASVVREMSPCITVFSNIPKLTTCLRDALPNLHFQEVSPGVIPLHFQFTTSPEVSENSLKVLQNATIIVGDYNLVAPHLYNLPHTKWIQGTWAGADPILKAYDPNRPLPGLTVTRFSGPFFAMQMSEYVVANIVNRERRFLSSFYESQKKHVWARDGWFPFSRTIFDLTIGILGTGAIGRGIAKVLKAFNATVWGVGRTPLVGDQKLPDIDEYRVIKDLPEVLSHCDYVVNVLPETRDTVGLLGGGMLRHCAAKKSVLINIGRGSVITNEELLQALEQGWLSGAVLDVFPNEPLPKESPLWDMPQVSISPHIAGVTRPQDVAKMFKENYARFQAGQPLLHQLDLDKGY